MPETLLTAWLRKPAATASTPAPPPPSKALSTSTTTTASAPPPTKRDQTSAYTPALPPSSSDPPPTADTPRTPFSTLRPLPANLHLVPPSAPLLPSFKSLNSALFPFPYPSSFYTETTADPIIASITLFALWDPYPPPIPPASHTSTIAERGFLIGAVRCRLVPPASDAEKPVLYISTLCVSPAYRGHGCATHLLAAVTARAVGGFGVGAVSAHVWEKNEEGRAWYKARGFEEVGRMEGYYRRLKPGGAVVVRRVVEVRDGLGG